MSGQWEQYVEKAAVSIDPAAFDKKIENHDGLIRKFRRDRATELAQGVLAVVGPLIAEDTRTRMVEAAAAAVKREGHACRDCEECGCECPDACAPGPCPCFGDSRHWSDGSPVDDAEMEANSHD